MLRSILLSRTAKLLISLILVAAVVWQVGPEAVIPETVIWRWLAAAVLLFTVSNILGSYQWNLLLRSAGIELPYAVVLRAYYIALFFNNFLIGNVGGDVLRALDVRSHTESGKGNTEAGVATIVMDRFLGFFIMLCFAVAALFMVSQNVKVGTAIFVLLGVFIVVGVLITSRRLGTAADGFVKRLLPDSLSVPMVNLRRGFVAMRLHVGILTQAVIISAFVQGMRIVVHYLCAISLGLDIPFVYFVTFIPLVSVAAAIPISTGGLGTREWAAVGLFATVGIAGAGVVTMELLAHAVTLISSVPGAIAFIARRGRGAKLEVKTA